MSVLGRCYNIADLRSVARRRLPKWIFEFVDRGTEDEIGIRHGIEAFQRIKFRNRAMVDLSGRDLGATLFGRRISLPAAIAPTGAAGLCWYEGELALAKAAAKFGVPFTMAVGSTTPLEKVAEQAGGWLWFQIYLWENRQLTYDLVKRAETAGYDALVVTVDVNLGTNREFNQRNGYGNPFRPGYRTVRDILLRPEWMVTVLFRYLATSGMPRQANNPPIARNQHGSVLRSKDGRVSWDDVSRLRERWPGKLIIKGLLRAEDAARAVELGADAVVVSTHGGRNLDGAVASIDALPSIAAEVGDRATVLLDSGIRRGSDMAKAYALGADAVLLGRAALWGAAAGGEAGAGHALSLLRREYEFTLGHLGCRNSLELGPEVLATDAPFMGFEPRPRRASAGGPP
jgi:(S)-mandelate dehydrogenase